MAALSCRLLTRHKLKDTSKWKQCSGIKTRRKGHLASAVQAAAACQRSLHTSLAQTLQVQEPQGPDQECPSKLGHQDFD